MLLFEEKISSIPETNDYLFIDQFGGKYVIEEQDIMDYASETLELNLPLNQGREYFLEYIHDTIDVREVVEDIARQMRSVRVKVHLDMQLLLARERNPEVSASEIYDDLNGLKRDFAMGKNYVFHLPYKHRYSSKFFALYTDDNTYKVCALM